MRLLSKFFHEKLKMPANQLEVLHSKNFPKIFMFSIMILKWKYRLIILILLKVLKNASMETDYNVGVY